MTPALRTLVCIVVTLWWTTPSSAACLSDRELQSVLGGVFVYGLGQTLGACSKRYPPLKSEILKSFDAFQKKYSLELKQLSKKNTEIFERKFPGRGKQERDRNDVIANRAGLKQVWKFSQEECKKAAVKAMEAMVLTDNFNMVIGGMVGMVFVSERARIPRCQ